MKTYECPRCEWELMKTNDVLCDSFVDTGNETYVDGGDYEW